MDTTFHSSGNSTVSVHDVQRIDVSANSVIRDNGEPLYWQSLTFLDGKGQELGKVTVFLESPEAALPVGDQPPYWGLDLSEPPMAVDGKAPF
ncbi:MAG: hypothetical protein GY703_06590 [Gammaproteobacteria bacterium]|nr:hypothetical protein [Gammaproteobacteria bacterium]